MRRRHEASENRNSKTENRKPKLENQDAKIEDQPRWEAAAQASLEFRISKIGRAGLWRLRDSDTSRSAGSVFGEFRISIFEYRLFQNHIAQVSAVLAVTIFHEDAYAESATRRQDGLSESDNLSGIDGLQGHLAQFLTHHSVEVGD